MSFDQLKAAYVKARMELDLFERKAFLQEREDQNKAKEDRDKHFFNILEYLLEKETCISENTEPSNVNAIFTYPLAQYMEESYVVDGPFKGRFEKYDMNHVVLRVHLYHWTLVSFTPSLTILKKEYPKSTAYLAQFYAIYLRTGADTKLKIDEETKLDLQAELQKQMNKLAELERRLAQENP